MANKQILKVHGVTANGIALGGVSAMSTPIQDIEVETPAHSAFGNEFNESIGKRILASLTTLDVNNIGALIAATPGTLIAHLLEASSAPKDSKYTIGGTGGLVLDSVTATFPVGALASMNLGGEFRWGAGQDLDAMMVLADDQTVVAPTRPDRYVKPNTVLMGATPILHVSEITFSATARVAQDIADVNNGPETIEIIGWNAPRCQVTFKDAEETGVEAVDMQQKLIAQGQGELTAVLQGVGVGDATLTISNVQIGRAHV